MRATTQGFAHVAILPNAIRRAPGRDLATGFLRLMTKDAGGSWIDAVDANVGGTKHFVLGTWKSYYGLGTYGIDPATNTAWAVVNHNSSFATVPEPSTLDVKVPIWTVVV